MDVDMRTLNVPAPPEGRIEWTIRGLAEVAKAIGNPRPIDLFAILEVGSGAEPLLASEGRRIERLGREARAVPRLFVIDRAAEAAAIEAPYYETVLSALEPAILGASDIRTQLASVRFDPADEYTWWIEFRPSV